MKIEAIPGSFSVCRLTGLSGVDLAEEFVFLSRTDSELSLVCKSESVPANAAAEGGWRMLRVIGPLDFSLVGVLAGITSALAQAGVPVFAISTYDTDYFLVRKSDWPQALAALKGKYGEII